MAKVIIIIILYLTESLQESALLHFQYLLFFGGGEGDVRRTWHKENRLYYRSLSIIFLK